MAEIDSLEIVIQSEIGKVNTALDTLARKLGIVSQGISAIRNNKGLEDFAKKVEELSSSIEEAGENIERSMKPAEKQMQKASKNISEIAKEFQEDFKNIPVKVDFSKPESELKKFQNQARNAQNALERIMSSSTADKQVKAVEKWSISLAQANNAVEQLQKHLSEQTKLNVKAETEKIENADDIIERIKSHIQQMNSRKQMIESPVDIGKLTGEQFELFQRLKESANTIPENLKENKEKISSEMEQIKNVFNPESLKYNADAMAATFGEAVKGILTYQQGIEKFGENFAKVIDSFGISENTIEEKIKSISENFKDVGKDFDFGGNAEQIESEINKLNSDLEKLYAKRDKKIDLGEIDTKPFKDIIYEIQLIINRLDILEKQKPEALNRTLQENAEKAKVLREQLKQLKIPEIQEDNIEKLNKELEKAKGKMSSLKAELSNKLVMGKITASVDDSGYRDMREQIALTGKNIDAIQQKIKEVSEKTKDSSAEMAEAFENNLKKLQIPPIKEENINKLKSILEKTENQLDKLKVKLENDIQMGKITASVDDSGYRKTREEIALTEKEIDALKQKIKELGGSNEEIGILTSSLNGLKTALHAPVSIIKLLGKTLKSLPSRSVDFLTKSFKNFFDIVKKVGATLGKTIGKGISKLAKSLLGLGKANKQSGNSFKNSLKTMLKYAFGLRTLFALMNKIRAGAKEGFKNLAQYSGEVNGSISSMMSALTTLKNGLAVAFAPILNVVAPYITQFINLLTSAANAVGRFFSALTGKSIATQTLPVVEDFANSISGSGKAAKGASKDLNKYIASWQEVNNMTSQESSGSGASEMSAMDMFTEVEVEKPISDLAKKIKEAWKNFDFTEVGGILGNKINEILNNIPWKEIQQKAYNIGKSLATLLNGIFQTEGLGERIGSTLAEVLNTALNFAYGFIHNFDFSEFGKFLGEGINGAFLTFD